MKTKLRFDKNLSLLLVAIFIVIACLAICVFGQAKANTEDRQDASTTEQINPSAKNKDEKNASDSDSQNQIAKSNSVSQIIPTATPKNDEIDLNALLSGEKGAVSLDPGSYYLSSDLNLIGTGETEEVDKYTILLDDTDARQACQWTIDFKGHNINVSSIESAKYLFTYAIQIKSDYASKVTLKNSENTGGNFNLTSESGMANCIYCNNACSKLNLECSSIKFANNTNHTMPCCAIINDRTTTGASLSNIKCANCEFVSFNNIILWHNFDELAVESCAFSTNYAEVDAAFSIQGSTSKFENCTWNFNDEHKYTTAIDFTPYTKNDGAAPSITIASSNNAIIKSATGMEVHSDTDASATASACINIDANTKFVCDRFFEFSNPGKFAPILNVGGTDKILFTNASNYKPALKEDAAMCLAKNADIANRMVYVSSNPQESPSIKYWKTVTKKGDYYSVGLCGPRCIKTQPTNEKPQVALNGPTPETCNVQYQWYGLEAEKYAIDDTQASGDFILEGAYTKYEDSNWVPTTQPLWVAGSDWGQINYVTIYSLKQNSILKIKVANAAMFKDGKFVLKEATGAAEQIEFGVNQDTGEATIEVPIDGAYFLTYGQKNVSAEQTLDKMDIQISCTKINKEKELTGQNSYILRCSEPGNYRCKVTWTGDANSEELTELSDVVNVEESNLVQVDFGVDEKCAGQGNVSLDGLAALNGSTYAIVGDKVCITEEDGKTTEVCAVANEGYVFGEWKCALAGQSGSLESDTNFTASFNLIENPAPSDDGGLSGSLSSSTGDMTPLAVLLTLLVASLISAFIYRKKYAMKL